MKQNLTKKQVIIRFFSVTEKTGLIFSVRKRPPPNQHGLIFLLGGSPPNQHVDSDF